MAAPPRSPSSGCPERLEFYEGQVDGRSRAILVAHPERTREGGFIADRQIENWPGAIEKGANDAELAWKKEASR